MSDERATLRIIVDHLAGALAPLGQVFRDETEFRTLMWRLGWDAQGLPPGYLAIADAALAAVQAARVLASNADATAVLAVLQQAGNVYQAVQSLGEAPPGVDPAQFLPEIGRRLIEHLLASYLVKQVPALFNSLRALDVIRQEHVPATEGRPSFVATRFEWEKIPEILSDPLSIPTRVFGWGTADLDFEKVVAIFSELFLVLDLPSSIDFVAEDFALGFQAQAVTPSEDPIRIGFTVPFFDIPIGDGYEDVGFSIRELPAEGSALPGIIVVPVVPQSIALDVPIGEGWSFKLRASTDLADRFGLFLRPGEIGVRYPFAPGQTFPSAGFGAALAYEGADPGILFGEPGGIRLELAKALISGEIDFKNAELEFKVAVQPQDMNLVIAPGSLDGFLGNALAGQEAKIAFPISLTWSNRTGLDFTAGAGFEVSLYPHFDIGILHFDRIDLAVRLVTGADVTPALSVRSAAALSGALGPIGYSVDRIAAELAIVFQQGNAGPFDIDFRILPPTGLGLVIDAGFVTGGGFISHDPELGRYSGVLELDMFGVGVSAIGILDTKDAAGNPLPSPGYSFLLSICAEFAPIQLGFGFTLNGVGGLIAINRRMDTTAFLAGLREGALDSVLFPEDPIDSAPTIIGNLSALFPVAIDRHVFGPMAILGWGTPTLVTLELGILLEVPAPVMLALIGQAAIAIPSEELKIVSINIDVLGIYDPARKQLSVDATLRDSYVALYSVSGDMAMRLCWGAQPNFALAVGGLNPAFSPPAGFPTLRRTTVALGIGENPRISLESYFAITSNSLQFGARAELYAEAAGFNVQGWVGYDALLIYEPFSFNVDFSAGMTLSHGSQRIAAITVEGHLTGPSPFHAWGKGCLSLAFGDVCVPFDATFGERRENDLPPKDPWPLLDAAIKRIDNWHGELSGAVASAIALRAPTVNPDALLIHPMGAATLRQKVLPLDRPLERFGQYEIVGPHRYDIVGVKVGDAPASGWSATKERFAPGDFEALSATEQLSRDSFEEMDAGVSVGGDFVDAPLAAMKIATIDYETSILDSPWGGRALPVSHLERGFQLVSILRGAKARSSFARTGAHKFAAVDRRAKAVALVAERYAVATVDALAKSADFSSGVTKGAASIALKTAGTRGGLQVVPLHELEAAA
jgi:hypothetical protein